MNGLPSVLTRPPAVLDPVVGAPPPSAHSLQTALDAGIPARAPLVDDLRLVLSVGAGQIRRYLDGDPGEVLVAIGGGRAEPDADTYRDPDAVAVRVSLVSGSTLGDTTPVVLARPVVLGIDGRAVVEVTVSTLTVSNGSLRSPGQYGSALALTWRDLRTAGDTGPVLPLGDPSIPPRLVWRRLGMPWFRPGVLQSRLVVPADRGWLR